MGFAIIVDTTADYGFTLRGDTQPDKRLFPIVESHLDRNLSTGDITELDGQHIGFATDTGTVSLYTQYRRFAPHSAD